MKSQVEMESFVFEEKSKNMLNASFGTMLEIGYAKFGRPTWGFTGIVFN